MTRFDRQEQIYHKIQSVETELADCSAGSSRWLELSSHLNSLLREYAAVPQDVPSHPHGPGYSFRQSSRMFLVQIWLTVFGLLIVLLMSLATPFMNRNVPWLIPSLSIAFSLVLVWAIWASCPLKE